ncbi:MAG: gliding motility-associated C-terminal domain-containing protein [Bacteroidia bacterium]|nr:gliding motility-associated C-terminal domain-containing protein [Bacteroidia bacterium]
MDGNQHLEQQFDALFKQTLNNVEIPAPEGVWNQIAQSVTSPVSTSTLEPMGSSGSGLISGLSTIGKIIVLSSVAAIIGSAVYFLNSAEQSESISTPVTASKTQEQTPVEYDENTISVNQESATTSKPAQESTISPTKADADANTIHKNTLTEVPSKAEHKNLPVEETPKTEQLKNTHIEPSQNINVLSIEKSKTLISDTVLCFAEALKPTQIFGNRIISNIQIFEGERQITVSPMSVKNKWLIARANTRNGDKIERRFMIAQNTPSIEISNAGKEGVLCDILNWNSLSNVDWFINNELINEDVKQIVYYRNMESTSTNTALLSLHSTDHNGCTATYTEDISRYFYSNQDIMIPTVITPNNDGLNDKWIINIEGAILFNVKVVGPSNTIIFQTNNLKTQWDGNDMNGNAVPAGSYIYQLNYQLPNQSIKTQTGIIQIIRN